MQQLVASLTRSNGTSNGKELNLFTSHSPLQMLGSGGYELSRHSILDMFLVDRVLVLLVLVVFFDDAGEWFSLHRVQ